MKLSERKGKYHEEKSINKLYESDNNNNFKKFAERERNKVHTNRNNFKESKIPINYNYYDIDKKIDSEFCSPDKKLKKLQTNQLHKDSDSDTIFKTTTKKISQNFKKDEYQNLLDYSQSYNQIRFKDELLNLNNNPNNNSINNLLEKQNKKNHEKQNTEMKIIVTEEDKKTPKVINFKSNSFKKHEKQSPIVTKEIKEFESKVQYNKTNSLNLSQKNNQIKKLSSSFKLNDNDSKSPKNFFKNFENEIEKHKKELFRFNSGNLFNNLDKDQILDKIHQKQLKMNEIERKRELSRKKVNFNFSENNIKQNNSLDLSSIKRNHSNTSRFNIVGASNKNSENKIGKFITSH